MNKKENPSEETEPLGEEVSDEKLESIVGGATFRPEIDDEVLVAFEQGDVQSPYVIGGLWSGKSKP